jgi:hypothetical protein
LEFSYPEVKDLAKQFLTVVAAVLALSVTFSDRVVHFAAAARPVRALMLASWACSVLAFVLGGVAIVFIFDGGRIATHEVMHRYRHDASFGPYEGGAITCMSFAGLAFVLSLILLVCAEIFGS